MNNILVTAVIDTAKKDTIELQFLPGCDIQEQDVISYDKMNGLQLLVKTVAGDLVTCSIIGQDIFHIALKYFQSGTSFFPLRRTVGEFMS